MYIKIVIPGSVARSSYILRKSQNIPGFEETGQTITRNYSRR